MNKPNSKQLIILAFLILILIGLIVNLSVKIKLKNKKVRKNLDALASEIMKQKPLDIDAYFDSTKKAPILPKDPFYRLQTNNENKNELRLIGIAQDNNESYAIINNSIVKKGAVVDGAEVVEIQKNKVILLRNNVSIELQLPGF